MSKVQQSQNSAVVASSRSVSTKRETRSSKAAQLANEKNLPEASIFDQPMLAAAEEPPVLRDITSQTINDQVKRGRGRPRKQMPCQMNITIAIPKFPSITKECPGELSGEDGKKISEANFVANFKSISSILNNVDEADQKESQKVNSFSDGHEGESSDSQMDIPETE
jgi:hypothetical protein